LQRAYQPPARRITQTHAARQNPTQAPTSWRRSQWSRIAAAAAASRPNRGGAVHEQQRRSEHQADRIEFDHREVPKITPKPGETQADRDQRIEQQENSEKRLHDFRSIHQNRRANR
jgi:DNA repair ATPase RecN